MMEFSTDIHDFIEKGNLVDLEKIINKKFKNVLPYVEVSDVISAFVCKCIENKIIEKFDPNKGVKFSTYMYTCIFNFVLAYYTKPTKMVKALRYNSISLDHSYNDDMDGALHSVIADDNVVEIELSIEKQIVYNYLKKEHSELHKASIPLYQLYLYIVEGHTDKGISDMTNITVAGVGARKKTLVKKLKHFMVPQ